VKFGVIVFPGSNCDQDCFYVLKEIMKVEVDYIWHKDSAADKYDCLVLPGGFSYGDYLRTGAIARFSPVMRSVAEFAEKGRLVIGICNGFQILCEAGLLPGALINNASLEFICRWVNIKVENADTPFTNIQKKILKIPIAHAQGNYFHHADAVKKLEDNMLAWIKENDLGNAQTLWPLRVALTGKAKSPSPFEAAWLLGKEDVLRRIDEALELV